MASGIRLYPTHRWPLFFIALILRKAVHSDANDGHQQPTQSVSAVIPGEGEKSFLSSSRQSSKADKTYELAKPGSGWGQRVALPKAHGLRVRTGDFPQEREFCYQKGCWAAKATFVYFHISVIWGDCRYGEGSGELREEGRKTLERSRTEMEWVWHGRERAVGRALQAGTQVAQSKIQSGHKT